MSHSHVCKLACNRLGSCTTKGSHNKIVMEWISSHEVQDLKHLLGDHIATEEGMAILRERKKFVLHQVALYHHHTLAGELEEALWFVVPMAHTVVAMNGCHRDMGHQGQW